MDILGSVCNESVQVFVCLEACFGTLKVVKAEFDTLPL